MKVLVALRRLLGPAQRHRSLHKGPRPCQVCPFFAAAPPPFWASALPSCAAPEVGRYLCGAQLKVI